MIIDETRTAAEFWTHMRGLEGTPHDALLGVTTAELDLWFGNDNWRTLGGAFTLLGRSAIILDMPPRGHQHDAPGRTT